MTELLALLRSAVQGIWRQRWWALVLAVAVGAAGFSTVMKIPARYEASARVYVDTQSILQPLLSGLAVQPNVDQQVAMMGRTILSRPNLERVLRMSDLDLASKSEGEREAALDRLAREIRLQAAPGSTLNLFSITYSSSDPASAQKVVQSLLALFVESNVGEKRRDAEQAQKFIDDQLKGLEKELAVAENRLKEFKVRNIGVLPSAGTDHVAKSNDILTRLTQARLDLREAENSRDELKRQLSGETPSFALAPEAAPPTESRPAAAALSRSDVDVRLEAQRKQLDSLLSKYTDEHPDVIGTRRIIQQLEQQRDDERKAAAAASRGRTASGGGQPAPQRLNDNPVYQQLKIQLVEAEGQVAGLRARVSGLEGQLAQSRSAAQAVPRVEAELTQLTRDYELHKRNYDQLVQRRETARLSGNLEGQAGLAEFRIVDPPRVGSKPVSPNRPLLLAAVLAASLVAGIAFAFLKDLLRPVYHDLHSLRTGTQMPLLGIVSVVVDARARLRERLATVAFSGATLAYVLGFFAMIVMHATGVRIV